ncbi:MAG TPA: Holliday junction branch migration protein RuvA [Virgibacillus sp.]|nr:Holliday junction branch migration protein RuvA [Virgibacillus sp.]
MIAYIKGILTYIQDDSVIVDVHGIGYEIICANPFDFQLSLNKEVFIYTYHHVREDIESLYGFKTEDEKYLFTKLISVSGIGPKSGINIQGSVDVAEFISAVEREDEKYLTQFPGVGKKTARQIILDLKGKLTGLLFITSELGEEDNAGTIRSSDLQDAEEALKSLGYSAQEIRAVIPQLQQEDADGTDEIIRKALALLMRK